MLQSAWHAFVTENNTASRAVLLQKRNGCSRKKKRSHVYPECISWSGRCMACTHEVVSACHQHTRQRCQEKGPNELNIINAAAAKEGTHLSCQLTCYRRF